MHVTDYAISVARARLSPTPMDVFLRREAASQQNMTKRTEQAGVGIAEPSPLSTRDHFAKLHGQHSGEGRKTMAELAVANGKITNNPMQMYAADKVGGFIISPRSTNNISPNVRALRGSMPLVTKSGFPKGRNIRLTTDNLMNCRKAQILRD